MKMPFPRRSLAEQLAREGTYTVIEAGSAAEARAARGYVFAIIDGALTDSEALGRGLRAQGFDGPILFLTESERAAGEYLIKPFRFSALLARLSAHLGHHGASEDRVIADRALSVPARRQAADRRRRAASIRLTEKETNILKFLHGGRAHRAARNPVA